MFLVSYDVNVPSLKYKWRVDDVIDLCHGYRWQQQTNIIKKLFVKENECCFDLARKRLKLINPKDFGG